MARQPFDFDLDQHHQPENPSSSTQQSPKKSSQRRRWSTSTDGSKFDYYESKASTSWEAPPVPPIPPDEPSEAWRKRTLKRDSYTSQMSLRRTESAASFAISPAPTSVVGDALMQSPGVNTSNEKVPAPIASARSARTSRHIHENRQYEELHWQVSGLNPKGWSRRRKWMHTLAAGGVAFAVLFSSSIVAPARGAIEKNFSVSPLVAVLSTALYILGLAFGSILGTASSALIGRKVTQACSLLFSVAFTVASACVGSFAALHACRFFAGLFASPALWIGLAILLEMWRREKMAMPLTAFTALALAGLTVGPVAGSYTIKSQSVRWTQYTIIIVCAAALALVLATRETHKLTVQRAIKPSLSEALKSGVVAPLAALLANPTILLLSIFAGTILGTLYTALTAFASVLESAYDFSLPQQGLAALALLVGILLAAVLLALDQAFIYRPRVAKLRRHYDAEVERALAEEKQLKRRSRRNSRANSNKLQKRKSTASLFSSSASASTPAGSRISLLLHPFAKRDTRSDLLATTIDAGDENVALSVAAAEHLNSVNEKRILPERILLILSKQPPFNEACDQLEAYGLRVDRVKLAQVFIDALQQQAPTETRPVTAETELESVRPASRPTLNKMNSTATLLTSSSSTFRAPAVWRLWPALPASILAAGGLFLFAWTAKAGIHWIAPIIGLGLFAAGGATVLVSSTLFTLEKYGEDAVAGESIVVWLLAGIFPLFGVPMFASLGSDWAGSVLGFIVLGCAIPVWVIVLKGR